MVNTGMALFVLPMEAERLNRSNGSLWVGIYLAVCGATQVICPVAGKLSDRHASKYGRRRPYIMAGTLVTVLAFGVMRIASIMIWPKVYIVFLFCGEVALNIVYSAQCGLPADLQPVDKGADKDEAGVKGIVSGYVALHSFLGSIAAMVMIYLTRTFAVQVEYPIYMSSLVVACFIVCTSVREAPSDHLVNTGLASLSAKELVNSFTIDLSEDLDFFWVCAGRVFYYISTSGVVFLYYYIRDMIKVGHESSVRSHLATLVIFAQFVGAACSIPCSRLSNKIGRKSVIYAANVLMGSTFVLYTLAPLCGAFAWPVVLAAGFSFGMGSGAYLSVDYALALDCMPVGKSAAEAFGLWGVAGFIGSTVGPLAGGFLLSASLPGGSINTGKATIHRWPGASPGGATEEYPFVGYALVLLLTGTVMNGVVAALTSRIQSSAVR
jgi:MFS family permease